MGSLYLYLLNSL